MALCIDLGTYSCKAGFGGLESTKISRWMPDVILNPVDNNNNIIYEMPISSFDHAEANGCNKTRCVNVDRFQELFYKVILETNIEPVESSILISTPMASTMLEKHHIASILFEEFNCKSLYFGHAPVFAAFANGYTSAIVLDSGHNYTSLTSINDGVIDRKNVSFFSIAGKDITDVYGKCVLSETKDNDKLSYQFEVGSNTFWPNDNLYSIIKEKFAFVSKNMEHDRAKAKNGANLQRYKLPDGSWMTISQPNYEAPQILFNLPTNENNKSWFSDVKQYFGNKGWKKDGNIVDMFYDFTVKLNKELDHSIPNVLFTGGNTMIKNFYKKFQQQLRHVCKNENDVIRGQKYIEKILQPDTKFQANKYAAWAGCSILAGYSPLTPFYVTKNQYNEIGDEIITARYS